MFYQDLFNWILAWVRSRRWGQLLYLALFPGLMVLLTAGLVIKGASWTRQKIASHYLALVHSDVEASMRELMEPALSNPVDSSGTPSMLSEGAGSIDSKSTDAQSTNQTTKSGSSITSLSSTADVRQLLVPLRRIMQLGDSNERVTYLVAVEMFKRGRTAMAGKMMRGIAPERGQGFPPAHAFMAEYTLASWKGTQAQAKLLLADYARAESGGVKMPAAHLTNYARLLDEFDRRAEALNMLQDHADEHPELNGVIVQIAGAEGSDGRNALAAGRADFEAKREANTATLADVHRAVQLELMDDRIDAAMDLASYGLNLAPESPEAKRLFSSVVLLKHRDVTEKRQMELSRAAALGNPPPPLDLRYLELAAKIDSSNPALSEELAKAMSTGQSLTEELKQTLERSLVDGSASAVTHLILANHKLVSDDPHTALPQLRLAFRQMPNSPIVMNNLAYAIMKYDTENLSEAQQLIERALLIPGVTLADRASMLDTLADIRLAQDDNLGAIEMYEEALKHNPEKVNTRQKLADAYAEAGMDELAEGQRKRIEELSKKDEELSKKD